MAVTEVAAWRKRYRDAVEVVDAANVGAGFRNAVRQALNYEFSKLNVGDAAIESAVTQICYRAADLSYLLAARKEALAVYSEELRKEGDEEESGLPES